MEKFKKLNMLLLLGLFSAVLLSPEMAIAGGKGIKGVLDALNTDIKAAWTTIQSIFFYAGAAMIMLTMLGAILGMMDWKGKMFQYTLIIAVGAMAPGIIGWVVEKAGGQGQVTNSPFKQLAPLLLMPAQFLYMKASEKLLKR